MSILYKSSSLSTYGYYFIYPLLICICIFFTYGILSHGDFGLFIMAMTIIFIYIFITSIESLYHLKYIEVTENNILVKTIRGSKVINFKDILYTYNLINIDGASLVIWYKEETTNKIKVILVRPENKIPPPAKGFPVYSYEGVELEITKYIKEKAIKENANYLNINNPRWFLFSISPTFKIF